MCYNNFEAGAMIPFIEANIVSHSRAMQQQQANQQCYWSGWLCARAPLT